MGTRIGSEDFVGGGGFEPEIGAKVNSPESLVSMIAAGRKIFLSPEIGIGGRTAALDFYRLNERESQFSN